MAIVITTEKVLKAGEMVVRYGTAATVGVITGVLTSPVRGNKIYNLITNIGAVGIGWVVDGQVTEYYRKNIAEPILEIKKERVINEMERLKKEWRESEEEF